MHEESPLILRLEERLKAEGLTGEDAEAHLLICGLRDDWRWLTRSLAAAAFASALVVAPLPEWWEELEAVAVILSVMSALAACLSLRGRLWPKPPPRF